MDNSENDKSLATIHPLADIFLPNIVDSFTAKDGSTYEMISRGDPPRYRVQFFSPDCSYSWRTDFGTEVDMRALFDNHVKKSRDKDGQ